MHPKRLIDDLVPRDKQMRVMLVYLATRCPSRCVDSICKGEMEWSAGSLCHSARCVFLWLLVAFAIA